MMKYPKDIGPQSQTEFLAMLFSMLGNAYNLLAQYEAEERHLYDEVTKKQGRGQPGPAKDDKQ
jgi:hypothetical protein